jgi:hypothetical protein
LQEIDAIQRSAAFRQCECKTMRGRLEADGVPESRIAAQIQGCVAGAAQWAYEQIQPLQAELNGICSANNMPPAPEAELPPMDAEDVPEPKRAGVSATTIGGILLLVVLGGGYLVYRGVKK